MVREGPPYPKNTQDQEDLRRFEELYRKTYSAMLRSAEAALRASPVNGPSTSGRAEEIVQEAYLVAWKRRDMLFASEDPSRWLFKALAFKAKELLREDRNWAEKTERLMLYREEHSDVIPAEQGLDGMPKEDYALLHRVYVEGYTYQEIAQETGANQSTLATRIQRIKERFRKNFSKI